MSESVVTGVQEQLSRVIRDTTREGSGWPQHTVTRDDENASLVFRMEDLGGLTVTATFSGSEWIVMSDIAPVSRVGDTVKFNEQALRLGMLLPLVSIGIMPIDGVDHYVVYGQLFADCKEEALREEVESCARAAIEVAESIEG